MQSVASKIATLFNVSFTFSFTFARNHDIINLDNKKKGDHLLMQNLIILFTLSLIQTLSVTFLTAAVIVILFRVQKYNSNSKTATNILVISVLSMAISTALILNIDFENLKQWMFSLMIVDLLAFLSGISIGVQNVKKS